MNKRVVSRKSRNERKNEIVLVVTGLTRCGSRCTARKIAQQIGLQPTTWLYKLLHEMYIECKLDYSLVLDSHGRMVYHWKNFVRVPRACDQYGEACATSCDTDCEYAKEKTIPQ